ncbi:transcriptional regulator with XRE-family HTH domain [Paenibacillus sp. BK033]|uniref:helix-turn-helix domain-containing protein n=1 Tax=Paenibacillus sp. BK033 TaxID=2512133 RepID=UPI0010491320|nr:helix-turn-helix transcriptional regulator [Paenibacillus sp. BK033]TCM99383.1 transcriptional regulator with XRE-family HTH domain [Paenibacillus sp. BK033]
MTEILKLVGARLRDLRKLRGLSQEQLGELAGFHFSYIGTVERGQANITLLNLEKLAKALDVDEYQFFSYTESLPNFELEGREPIVGELIDLIFSLRQDELVKAKVILKSLFD